MKKIDFHQHLDSFDELDGLVREYERLDVVRCVLLGLPPKRLPGNNEVVQEAGEKHPRLFIPFAGFDLDADNPEDLDRFRDRGFRGIKFIGPLRPYNDPVYFPTYETAARLKLPVVFHLGIVANTAGWKDCDSGLMRPVHLDHIARRIPELTIIGAHFGNPWSDEAAMACRWNPNLFFDFSGSLLKYRSPEYIGSLLWWKKDGPYQSPDHTDAWRKIVFGTDVSLEQVSDVLDDYEKLLRTLNLSPELREAVWYSTAAGILGV
jgi:uncharacterized protein